MERLTSGFLTQSIQRANPPLRDYHVWIKKIVLQALTAAWAELAQQSPDVLIMGSEPEITTCLQMVLNDFRETPRKTAPGFTGSLFETVVRDAAEIDFRGGRLEKRPDLAIRTREVQAGLADPQFRAMFIECKIIGRNHPVRKYCKDGVARFVDGEYAWAMPSAMMVGYARHSTSVTDTLAPYLLQHWNSEMDPFATVVLPVHQTDFLAIEQEVHITEHERRWRFSHGSKPGSIKLFHVWLPV